uniref:RRN7-type domain-containing protein n=1 Tax=Picocystis salinarum TaxID=88271 RepID=A0A7S3UA48_9CHLO|mmetsp:Transcript_4031/g.25334  ORF Transcript_4031/g.25334 Transcript_4031/m.25334 type:complete len:527 (+) Transcript_4031:115-1695(+)
MEMVEGSQALAGERCAACGSPNLEMDEGGFAYCLACGMQVYAYTQEVVETQENMRHFRSTRLQKRNREAEHEHEGTGPSASQKALEIVEAHCTCCQSVLEKQYNILDAKFGFHKSVRELVKGLWAVILDESEILSSESLSQATAMLDTTTQDEEHQASDQEEALETTRKSNRRLYDLQMRLRSKLNLEDLLSILYFACLWARKAVVGFDLLQWAVDGTLPFFSVGSVISPHVLEKVPSWKSTMNANSVPDMGVLDVGVEKLLLKTKLEVLPLNASALIARFVKDLDLPKQLWDPCRRLCLLLPKVALSYCPSASQNSLKDYRLPPTAFLMATLIVVLKLVYGLDGGTKAKAMSPFPPPYVWKDWAREQMRKAPRKQIWTQEKAKHCQADLSSMADYVQFCSKILFSDQKVDNDLKGVEQFLEETAKPFFEQPKPEGSARTFYTDFNLVVAAEQREIGTLSRELKFDRNQWSNMDPFATDYHAVVHACAAYSWLDPVALADAVYLVEDHLCSLEKAANGEFDSEDYP